MQASSMLWRIRFERRLSGKCHCGIATTTLGSCTRAFQTKGTDHSMSRRPSVITVFVAALVVSLALVPGALAGKGGPRGGGGTTTSGGGTIGLVLLSSTDGLPHWNQAVTFNVSTSATTTPWVRLDCYQGGVWVLSGTRGFFPDYPWGQVFGLSNTAWAGGAADCTATLFADSGRGTTTLAKTSFHVYA